MESGSLHSRQDVQDEWAMIERNRRNNAGELVAESEHPLDVTELPIRPGNAMRQRSNLRLFPQDASVVLIGCRGAGKRTLGFIGSLHLRRRLITEDYYFETTTGLNRGAYLHKHGKESFSHQNAKVFKRMLAENKTRCIIECGMSSLTPEAQEALADYCQTNPVIYLHRERHEVLPFLDEEDADQIIRADQSHRNCSNLEYYNLFDQAPGGSFPEAAVPHMDSRPFNRSKLLSVKNDFSRFLDLVLGREQMKAWNERPFSINAIPPEYRQHSYALRLRLSYLVDMDLEWEEFEGRGDCIELIIDHWPQDMAQVIARQVSLIRRKLGYPIIYHVEENPRGERRRAGEEKDRMDRELLELGLRLGVEYLSLDMDRNEDMVRYVLQRKGRSKVIGNYWNTGMNAAPWSDKIHVQNYVRAMNLGCDIIRMARFCVGNVPADEVEAFRQKLDQKIHDTKPPLVAYDYSVLGIRTPFQSRILNPVKHPDMESGRDHLATVTTAPQSFEFLFRQFLLDPLQFYILGSNVSSSLFPPMHQAAYEYCGMPHAFEAVQCSTLDELNHVCNSATFGGAYLSAPFKVAIVPRLKFKSHHAQAIGAVNVLIPLRGKADYILEHANSRNKAGITNEFYGDNVDWKTILSCLRRGNSPRNCVQPSKTTGLVIGAGGMARAAVYALIQMNVRHIFLYNRTIQNARDVARHFNEWAVEQQLTGEAMHGASPQICRVLTSASQQWPSSFQQPTFVISCVPTGSVDGRGRSDFEMPLQWLQSPTGGVALELGYEPPETRLVAQLKTFNDKVSAPWLIIDGLDNVGEVAIEAFELMTGRPAPRKVMNDTCQRALDDQRREMSSVSR